MKSYILGVVGSEDLDPETGDLKYTLMIKISEEVYDWLYCHDIKYTNLGERIFICNELRYIDLGEDPIPAELPMGKGGKA